MKECVECGAPVTDAYARVKGDNENRVTCRGCEPEYFDPMLRAPGQMRDVA